MPQEGYLVEDLLLEGLQLCRGDAAGDVDAAPDLFKGRDGGALLAVLAAEAGKCNGLNGSRCSGAQALKGVIPAGNELCNGRRGEVKFTTGVACCNFFKRCSVSRTRICIVHKKR